MNELRHPFRWIPKQHQKRVFLIAFVATLLLSTVLTVMGQGLQNDSVPQGIVSYEFAGDLATATQMIESWGKSGRILAGFHLGLDYLFLVLYPLSISLACALLATYLAPGFRIVVHIGIVLSWAQILAGLLDAIENAALYSLLLGNQNESLPQIAWWAAAIKFAIVIAGLLFVLTASAIALRLKAQKQTQSTR